MKTIIRLALIISLGGCFLAAEVEAAPINGKFVDTVINITKDAKKVKIPPPSAPSGGSYSGGSSAAPWVYGGSRAVNEYQKKQQRQEQQRQQRGNGYPTSRY